MNDTNNNKNYLFILLCRLTTGVFQYFHQSLSVHPLPPVSKPIFATSYPPNPLPRPTKKIFFALLILIFLFPIVCLANNFVDNEDGTISDLDTSLMWPKDGLEEGCGFGSYLSWQDAVDYCDTLTFATYDDWRLSTISELEMIVDYSISNPSINPLFTNTLSAVYWSSSGFADDRNYAWRVEFYYGGNNYDEKILAFYLRCVRDIEAPPTMETIELVQSNGTEFYLDKTFSYGDILIVIFLSIFLVFGIFIIIWRFVWEKKV